MLALLKNTVFLICLVLALVSVSISVSVMAFKATSTVARLGAEATATAIRHKKSIKNAVMKVKAKARLKRMMTMIPVAGLALGAYFEEQEYREWLDENPDGSRSDYVCKMSEITLEVLDEILLDFPKSIAPSESSLNSMIPKCP
mgnify:FL=1